MTKKLFLILTVITLTLSGLLLFKTTKPALPAREFVDELLGNAEVKVKSQKQASFLAVGDIMLSRNVATKIKEASDPLLPFRPLESLFQSVDFSFGNLESPFAQNPIIGGHSLIFGAPSENIEGLIKNNFKVLSLANNHALDQGLSGLARTIAHLDENNIQHVGAGRSSQAAWAPAVIEQNGFKICFVAASYSSINDNGKTTNDYVARIESVYNLQLAIKNLKSDCDFVTVSMHAGAEYTRTPNQTQIDFAHAAIDSGADLVIGHHPHWVQTIERYKGKYIFHSLGNFIFDQMWSQQTREGLALKMTITKNDCHPKRKAWDPKIQDNAICDSAQLQSIELIPIIIDNYSTPRLASEQESQNILHSINTTSTMIRL